MGQVQAADAVDSAVQDARRGGFQGDPADLQGAVPPEAQLRLRHVRQVRAGGRGGRPREHLALPLDRDLPPVRRVEHRAQLDGRRRCGFLLLGVLQRAARRGRGGRGIAQTAWRGGWSGCRSVRGCIPCAALRPERVAGGPGFRELGRQRQRHQLLGQLRLLQSSGPDWGAEGRIGGEDCPGDRDLFPHRRAPAGPAGAHQLDAGFEDPEGADADRSAGCLQLQGTDEGDAGDSEPVRGGG